MKEDTPQTLTAFALAICLSAVAVPLGLSADVIVLKNWNQF